MTEYQWTKTMYAHDCEHRTTCTWRNCMRCKHYRLVVPLRSGKSSGSQKTRQSNA